METSIVKIKKNGAPIFLQQMLIILLLTFNQLAHGAIPGSNSRPFQTVKIVYFYPTDSKLSSTWKNRLARVLKDISSYYKNELKSFGFNSDGIPFETDNTGFRYHLVQGAKPSNDYTINSGSEIEKEIFEKLASVINPSTEHVLVITSLSHKNENGTYIFHSPYYGRGSASSGLCMVADCELLDPALLTDATNKMTFTEMFATNKECTVGEFNSWYLGGIAHEMGHLFGLPHDNGFPNEFNAKTISLMGEHGSRHYKEEKWGGLQSSKFSRASVFQLSSHPLFTQRPKPLLSKNEFLLQSFKLSQVENTTKLSLHYRTDKVPYGVVALIRPYHVSEYLSNSFTSVVNQRNFAEIDIASLETNIPHEIRMLFLFDNGSVKEYRKMVSQSEEGHFLTVNNFGQATVNDLIRVIENDSLDNQKQAKLDVLNQLSLDCEPIDLKTVTTDSICLSDAAWEEASVGWENPARNYYTAESNKLFFLENMGKIYDKGLYAHAPSRYTYKLEKKWRKLKIIGALRDGAQKPEGIQFIIRGNGKTLSSHNIKPNEKHLFTIDIEDVYKLELVTLDETGNNFNAWSIWCTPCLTR
ncbi:NPCBM/NEW2 domain-containing protein [Sphingobacterium siyangense]|uniref:NPCBM/NEW2 domain-containing protein n=1 Tax=Sphingobacterium siyangense TaxID=459529 RepID=UPI002FDB0B78